MKTLFKISIMLMLLFGTFLNADNDLVDRGGKFGNKLPDLKDKPLIMPDDEMNNNRSSCYSYIWSYSYLKGRWWNYWVYKKVKAYAYTKTTYGNSRKSCGISYNAKKMKIDLILTDMWDYPQAISLNSIRALDYANSNNTSYLKADGSVWQVGGWLGKNILSYHTTELGWHTFKQTNLVKWD